MPCILLAFVLFMPLVFVLLLPVTIVQRYRVGTARRMARPWFTRLNAGMIGFSAVLFLLAAALMNVWVPQAFLSAVAGIAGGGLLGLLGLRLTRWEPSSRGLHYTPHRPLVLLITVVVAARIFYGFWRGWQAWENAGPGGSWLAASGAAGSLGVGGIVLGYYFVYWSGVARRLKGRGRLKVTRVTDASASRRASVD